MFMAMKAKYSHCLFVGVYEKLLRESKEIHILKKLKYLFDVYGIDCSEPLFQSENYFSGNYDSCNFIDYHGRRLITRYKNQEEFDRM